MGYSKMGWDGMGIGSGGVEQDGTRSGQDGME